MSQLFQQPLAQPLAFCPPPSTPPHLHFPTPSLAFIPSLCLKQPLAGALVLHRSMSEDERYRKSQCKYFTHTHILSVRLIPFLPSFPSLLPSPPLIHQPTPFPRMTKRIRSSPRTSGLGPSSTVSLQDSPTSSPPGPSPFQRFHSHSFYNTCSMLERLEWNEITADWLCVIMTPFSSRYSG